MKLSGKIVFDHPPSSFPAGSCMNIKVADDSRADAPSIEIAHKAVPLSGANNFGLNYSMSFTKPKAMSYGVDATINMGWCSKKGDSEWIHNGDYLTTTAVHVKVSQIDSEYTKDINVEYYRKCKYN